MSLLERLHESYVHTRRVRVICSHLAEIIPPNAKTLDVGCGDGLLAHLIKQCRPDIEISGIDLLVRNQTHIPVTAFDGRVIPYDDASFDVVLFVDVLHHTTNPMILLREAARVARKNIVIKDHLLNGLLAGPTLRLMDWVGNVRHGVALPYNYWSRTIWLDAFAMLDLRTTAWKTDLGLYSWPAKWLFDRSLHFIARLDLGANTTKVRSSSTYATGASVSSECGTVPVVQSKESYSDPWEAAYSQFETPEQERRKFLKRLTELGAKSWRFDADVVELFCGRGNGLHALSRLGFTQIEGVDLSASLLAQYRGPARCHRGDCRQLPFENRSRDIVIIQGGLHHLQTIPDDLERVLSEAHRVLRDNGLLAVVEPWLTPFLSLVHALCRSSIARHMSGRVDALATMIQYERQTYEQWLDQPKTILNLLQKYFEVNHCSWKWGKLMFVGRKKVVIPESRKEVSLHTVVGT